MTDSNNTQPPEEKEPEYKDKKHSGKGPVASLTFFVALVALAGVAYFSYFFLYQQRDLFTADIASSQEQLMDDGRALQERVSEQEKILAELIEKQLTLQQGIETLSQDLGRDRTGWALAETKQLLTIANYRLQLAKDIDTALTALKAADGQLKALANPKLLPVRKAIAEEISKLKALERVDITGITLRLGSLSDQVNKLPLMTNPDLEKGQKSDTQAGADSEQGFLGQMWADFIGLMRIRTDNKQHKILLAPEKNYFLRENLRLKLSGAQHALLAGDYASFKQNISDTITWIKQYFDTDSRSVEAALKELDDLSKSKSASDIPDISGSLELLNQYMSQQSDS